MARASNQKLKILCVRDFLLRNSDEEHPVTLAQITEELNRRGIPAERKSLYDDLETLTTYGMDIVQVGKGRGSCYYVGSDRFQLPELKLLVDSVQSSKFITQRKTLELIEKIEGLTSIYQARQLNRQVFVTNRIKAMNESIYYNVDEIHSGISQNRQIRFQYFEYTVQKEKKLRHDGAFYQVSPLALTWDDENYYLVAYDEDARLVKHFRVDKMLKIEVTDTQRSDTGTLTLDTAVYARKVFGMYHGTERTVRLRFEKQLVGAVLDRLGMETMIVPDGPDHFTVQTDVAVSPQFFGWLCGFGGGAQLLGPEDVIDQFREHLRPLLAQVSAE